jgi:NADH:ubiquinone oxidoreductase subunit 5 (subunit L)/multisubunit Na+/H+ antiporter MnhA subunit
MEKLGGLIHRMPQTAVAFLIGCMAISALPPLNGFVSEWLTFQAILVSPQLPQWGLRFLIPAVGALLALSAALAAACFVKVYGTTFLGRPRTPAAREAHEVELVSIGAMVLLAALCLVLGIVPGVVIDLLAPVMQSVVGGQMPGQSALPTTVEALPKAFISWISVVPIAESRSSYNGFVIFLFLLVVGLCTATFIHRFATRATRRGAIWDCGYPDPSPATQYTASSFAQPIRRVFGTTVFQVRERVDMPLPGETRPARFYVRVFDPAWRFAYGPLTRLVQRAAGSLNQLQFLTIRRYLTLVVSTLILLLLVVAAWR